MEAFSSLISSPPQFFPRTHLRNCSSAASSVFILHEQLIPAPTSLPTTLARYSPCPVLVQDQHDEGEESLSLKEQNMFQGTLDRRLMVLAPASPSNEYRNVLETAQSVDDFHLQLQQWISLSYLWPSLHKTKQSSSMKMEPFTSTRETFTGLDADSVVALAREALLASKEAASSSKDLDISRAHLYDPSILRSLAEATEQTKRTVRSTRLLERRSKKRKPKLNIEVEEETYQHRKSESRKKSDEGFDPNDPLRLFLWGPETKQLLSAEEESELIMNVQEFIELEEVKNRFHVQFSREPTLVEWASALGISCQALQSQIHNGNSSREKLINANLRLVVHIARQYQGHGLNFQDLLQEGSIGLMRSVEKFKPQAGCRFASYAYWWIRQAMRKALFQHSRTIRLPENVYSLLSKVYEAKKVCIQRGNHRPTKEDLAAGAGLTVERLERLLYTARMPLSIQQPVWMDQDTTFQEIIADTAIEVPELGVAKHLMRQHIRNLLSILSPRERKIIRLRFGIEDKNPKSLSEIGAGFGLSKERVRQLESRAMYKLKQCLGSQGLAAYADMLI